jgi:type VI secretion system protein
MKTLIEKIQGSKEDNINITKSIKKHLHQLLNTKQEAMPHLVDFGLPDLVEIYQGMPLTAGKLAQVIQQVLTKYEPRLTNITATLKGFVKANSVLFIEIAAYTLEKQPVHFETAVSPSTLINVT